MITIDIIANEWFGPHPRDKLFVVIDKGKQVHGPFPSSMRDKLEKIIEERRTILDTTEKKYKEQTLRLRKEGQEIRDKIRRIKAEIDGYKRRKAEPKSAYMIETDAFCEDILEHQVKSMQRRGWKPKEIRIFIIDSIRESRLRMKRIAKDYPIDPDWEPRDSDEHQNILREMYRFQKKHTPRY